MLHRSPRSTEQDASRSQSTMGAGKDAFKEAAEPSPFPAAPSPVPPIRPGTHWTFMAVAVLLDLLAVGAALFASSLLRFQPIDFVLLGETGAGVALILLGAIFCVTFLSAGGAYAPRVLVTRRDQLASLLTAVVPSWALVQLMAFWLKVKVPFESRLVMGVSLPASLLLLALMRLLVTRPLARRLYPRLTRGSVLVLGPEEFVEETTGELSQLDRAGRRHVARPSELVEVGDIPELIERHGYGEAIILANGDEPEAVFDTAFACLDSQADVRVISERFRSLRMRTPLSTFDGTPILRMRRSDLAGPDAVLKRCIDIVGAVVGLIALSPFFVIVAAVIKLDSRGPIMFSQERVGRRGGRFQMLKLRTMQDGNDAAVHEDYLKQFIEGGAPAEVREDGTPVFKLTNDARITKVGAWLRRYSLDELPQLWNVLRGDMSLVGPRPCTVYEWELHRPWQRRRMDVPPGCTGLWQVTARSQVAFEEMVLLDLHYAHTWTPIGDLRLIAQTIPAMIRGRGGL